MAIAVDASDPYGTDEVTSSSPLTGPAEPLTRTTEYGVAGLVTSRCRPVTCGSSLSSRTQVFLGRDGPGAVAPVRPWRHWYAALPMDQADSIRRVRDGGWTYVPGAQAEPPDGSGANRAQSAAAAGTGHPWSPSTAQARKAVAYRAVILALSAIDPFTGAGATRMNPPGVR